MNRGIIFLQKHRWKIVIVFTILYWFLVYLVLQEKQFWLFGKNDNLLIQIVWYFIILNWIFYTPKKNLIELYFNSRLFSEVEALIAEKDFVKYKEIKSKVKYKKVLFHWQKVKIVVSKNENGIWSISSEEKILKEFEKFMVRYT